MECLVAIGTTIVTTIAELTVAPIIRQVGYTIHYNENLKKLENQVGELSRARESMQHSVETEERKGNKIEEGVQFWLKEVDQLTKQADDFMKDEHHAATKCLRGFCPNLKLRHRLSRKSTKLAIEVAELEKKNTFANIAYAASPEEVCTIAVQDYEAFDSRTSTAEDVINELRKSDTYMIGVYGIGGVGKTTLVKEVYKQAKSGEKLFDEVVMVLDLKQNPSIERIQKAIAEKLGLELSEAGTTAGRASQICNRIKNKKTLVILDDVWENIDLEAVGLPRMATLKLLLTSRSKIVLASEMGTQKEFHLEVLNQEESWSLFQKMAGDIVKKPNIQTIAIQVAEKCGGLPLLIITVARALKDSSLHEWKDTFRRLKKFDGKGLTEKTSSAIEWSYNKLESEELKSVFLLCASEVGSDNSLLFLDLLKYSMGLGLIKNVDTMVEARDALHSLLKKLQYSCMLLDVDENQWISIHDLVKDVATHIAARDHHVLSVSHGSELKEWPDKEFCRKCTKISLTRCKTPEFSEVLHCPELRLFHLSSVDDESSREIPSNFFEEMKKLKVLDITNKSVPSLPSSLKWLKHLQTLCLDQCTLGDIALVGELQNLEILSFLDSKFHELPKEIGQLSRLTLLDLTDCSQLEVISHNVISRLRKLEDLRMGNSFNKWEAERVVDNSKSNASLEELRQLHRLTALQIHIPDANILPADLFTGSNLQKFQICIGSVWKWEDLDEALNALKLQLTTSNELDRGLKMLLEKTEDLYVEGTEGVKDRVFCELASGSYHQLKHLHVHSNAEFSYLINEKVGLTHLTWLAVSELNGLRFLLSFSMAKSLSQLKRLHISGCQIIEEIISTEECNKEFQENIFCQLQELKLKGLPNLTKFYSESYIEVPTTSCQRFQLEDSTDESRTNYEEIEEINSKENLDMVTQHFLFDNKVAFPNLKKLSIDGLAKLTTIWNKNLSPEGSSVNLETVKIVSCDNLKSIFPVSVAKSLQQLRRLIVKYCGVEDIISKEKDVETTPMFFFPELTYLFFENLPRLKRFYPGSHSSEWESLLTLAVYGCTNVKIFADRGIKLNNLCTPSKECSLFSLEKESFPNLESLGFDILENWDSPPLHLFRKLKFLVIKAHTNSSLDSLEKLLGFKKVKGEIHGVGDRTFPHLSELYLCGMRKLMNLGDDSFGPACPYFPKVEILKVKDCDNLRNLRSSAISFENLTTLHVSRCKRLKYLISFSMAKSLMQLTKLKVKDCEEMIEIVTSSGNDDSVIEIEFRVLKHLELSLLPSMRGFCSGTCIVKFPSLEDLSVSSCTQLEAFIFNPITIGKNIQDTDLPENFEAHVVERSLFDNKVELPVLESLSLEDLTKLTTIWHSQVSPNSFSRLKDLRVNGCANLASIFVPSTMGRLNALASLIIKECESLRVVFQLEELDTKQIQDASPSTQLKSFHCENLDYVEIDSCESLINIFPVSVARNLKQLKELIVESCGVKEIVAREEGLQTIPKFVFPKATHVSFDNLPQLTSFYPGMHVSSWPMLNNLEVIECFKANTLVDEISSFHGYDQHEHLCSSPIPRSLFVIEKDLFPNLERLVFEGTEICKGPLQVQLFSKLKDLGMAGLQCKSAVFLNGNNTTSNSSVGVEIRQQQQWQLPHLKELRLTRLVHLMHLGQEDEENNNSKSTPNIPYLEILGINGCDSLRNLRSSAISFNNLTKLHVSVCGKLEYLITYSVVKSLIQLTKLKVVECPRLVEIVGSNEDDDSRKEITFRRLKHLKLSDLPRLQGFCSKDCIVKFPSLETLTMSNRIKMKIFPTHDEMLQLTTEEEDTDVDSDEEGLTDEDEMNIGTEEEDTDIDACEEDLTDEDRMMR